MDLTFKTIVIGENTGYGNASRLLVDSLKSRGVEIHSGSSTQLNFCMPPDYEYSEYTIGYTPWESTDVPISWIPGLKAVDDLWVTSPFVKQVFSKYRKGDIFVLPHGIEECWTPFKHTIPNKPFTFLHVGEPAVRKGGDILLEAWHKAFKDRNDVRLVMKGQGYPRCRVKDSAGSIIGSPGIYRNVAFIGENYNQAQMWKLYTQSDAMVYPTRGEGFGLIPFEAIASGLPTIIPAQGCSRDYTKYATSLIYNSSWVTSPEEHEHPGQWLEHDVDELICEMEQMIIRYDKKSDLAWENALTLHQKFSWDSIGEKAVERITRLIES